MNFQFQPDPSALRKLRVSSGEAQSVQTALVSELGVVDSCEIILTELSRCLGCEMALLIPADFDWRLTCYASLGNDNFAFDFLCDEVTALSIEGQYELDVSAQHFSLELPNSAPFFVGKRLWGIPVVQQDDEELAYLIILPEGQIDAMQEVATRECVQVLSAQLSRIKAINGRRGFMGLES